MPSTHYPYLRRLVRALRLRHGWTQEAFAEKAGCDYKYFQLFEIGRTAAPSLGNVEKMAHALGVKPWVLLCDDLKLIAVHAKVEAEEISKPVPKKTGRPKKQAQDRLSQGQRAG